MCHKAVESLRLICYKLYVKSAFGIQQVYLFSELIRYFFWYLFFGIVGSYSVAILHCGYNIRHKSSLQGFCHKHMRAVFIIILIAVLLIALFLVKSRRTKLSGQSDRLSAVLLYHLLRKG